MDSAAWLFVTLSAAGLLRLLALGSSAVSWFWQSPFAEDRWVRLRERNPLLHLPLRRVRSPIAIFDAEKWPTALGATKFGSQFRLRGAFAPFPSTTASRSAILR